MTAELARPGEAALTPRVDGVRVAPGGDYVLTLVLREPDTNQSARAETPFRLGR